MSVVSRIVAVLAALSLAATASAEPPAATGSSTGEPGVWRNQKIELAYLGFTSTYSCDGLQSTLELLLRQLGARADFKVNSYACDADPGRPTKFPRAILEFATLQPAEGAADGAAAADKPVAGSWRSVELSPHRPFNLQDGDCELMEQFRDKVLPLFATRNVRAQISCVPYQDIGPFDLQLQVFAPLKSKSK